MAEFAYNNSKHATTCQSPFYFYTGTNPRMDRDLGKVPDDKPAIPDAQTCAKALLELQKELEERWLEAARIQALYYNKKVMPRRFNKGNMVWLSGKNIRAIRPCKKLDHKYYRP